MSNEHREACVSRTVRINLAQFFRFFAPQTPALTRERVYQAVRAFTHNVRDEFHMVSKRDEVLSFSFAVCRMDEGTGAKLPPMAFRVSFDGGSNVVGVECLTPENAATTPSVLVGMLRELLESTTEIADDQKKI